jgi:hypothetical protein
VDRGVIATASELFEARHYPSVVALLTEALDDEPDQVHLLLLRARAHIALRRDLHAQGDLRDIIRLDPQCALAYRLLGELAARRDENESAAIFFREALRLDPGDREAAEWLAIVEISSRPAAAAYKLPAPAAAAGRFPLARGPVGRAQTATDGGVRSVGSPARAERPGSHPRFAKGTTPPTDEQLTKPRAPLVRAPLVLPPDSDESYETKQERRITQGRLARGSAPCVTPKPVVLGSAATEPIRTLPGAQPLRRPLSQPRPRTAPELPGFGEYLVATGILTRERLRAAQAYQRSMKVQLATAIVTLGLATPQRIEWAAVAHQAQLARDGQ